MATHWTPNCYPRARRSDHVDTYLSATAGTVSVSDPYNWLEKHSEETDRWTSEQEAFTRTYLDQNPDRRRLEDAFRASVDYAKVRIVNGRRSGYSIYNSFVFCLYFSSAHQPCTMTAVGIGHITPVCNTNTVRFSASGSSDVPLTSRSVIYRSQDDKLPEFKDGVEPGEVFFDVRFHFSTLAYPKQLSAQSSE